MSIRKVTPAYQKNRNVGDKRIRGLEQRVEYIENEWTPAVFCTELPSNPDPNKVYFLYQDDGVEPTDTEDTENDGNE